MQAIGANSVSRDTLRRLFASSANYWQLRLDALLRDLQVVLNLLWDNLNIKIYQSGVVSVMHHFILAIAIPRGFGPVQVHVLRLFAQ